jgi:transcriptional regulator with XRE-family HTH domain
MTDELGQRDAYGHVNRQVGVRLETLRMTQNCDAQFVAKLCGVSITEYARLEAGLDRVSPQLLCKLSEIFGVDVGWFFDGLVVEGAVDGAAGDIPKDNPQIDQTLPSADIVQFHAFRANRRA